MFSDDCKYIVIESAMLSPYPIMFPSMIQHSTVWGWIESSDYTARLISAGFFNLDEDGNVRAYGEAVSLDVKANEEEDERLIGRALNL